MLHFLTGTNPVCSQQISDIPASHRKLVELSKQLAEQVKLSTAASTIFRSKLVMEALSKFIDLIIRTVQEIQQGSSKASIISMCSISVLKGCMPCTKVESKETSSPKGLLGDEKQSRSWSGN